MNNKLQFTIHATKGNARAGTISLNGIDVPTPAFMPVGTKATIKGMVLDMLQDPKYIGDTPIIQLILANTYHLYLRPGEATIKNAGGLHHFENWKKGLILTDSGGFQIFSLGLGKTNGPDEKLRVNGTNKSLCKLTSDGVFFRSIHDGSKHFFSPERCVDIQCDLGSDIMMVLDVCSPPGITEKKFRQHLFLTHQWAQRAFDHFLPKYDSVNGVLFPIVQGGTNLELRQESVTFLSQFAYDGIAVGGVSVGESHEEIHKVISFCGPKLPTDKPRYLMGVGDEATLRHAIENGFDMFDCIMPTRFGRHGMFYTNEGYEKISRTKRKEDFGPLSSDCPCFACTQFSKSYLHHLRREKEMLGATLLTLHNIVYLQRLVARIREEILAE